MVRGFARLPAGTGYRPNTPRVVFMAEDEEHDLNGDGV
jgi:hypothetical protein